MGRIERSVGNDHFAEYGLRGQQGGDTGSGWIGRVCVHQNGNARRQRSTVLKRQQGCLNLELVHQHFDQQTARFLIWGDQRDLGRPGRRVSSLAIARAVWPAPRSTIRFPAGSRRRRRASRESFAFRVVADQRVAVAIDAIHCTGELGGRCQAGEEFPGPPLDVAKRNSRPGSPLPAVPNGIPKFLRRDLEGQVAAIELMMKKGLFDYILTWDSPQSGSLAVPALVEPTNYSRQLQSPSID